jgi:multidrug efflux pump subunit AcrA (membrane-fusion protein)
LEKFVAAVIESGEPFRYDGAQSADAPQMGELLHQYLDHGHPRRLWVIPLLASRDNEPRARESVFGAMVVEHYSASADEMMENRAKSVGNQGGIALFNALRYGSLPTLPFARRRDIRYGGAFSKLTFGLVALLCTVIMLILIPADLYVSAQGELQPQELHHVFAPVDGQTSRLAVSHGDHINKGDVLLELISPRLDLEVQRVQGEYDTTRQRLLAIEASLLQPRRTDQDVAVQNSQLASQHEELKQMLESQKQQLRLLHQERAKLVVRSPASGNVLTWNLDVLLQDRPVQRGEVLVSVANLAGEWTAELHVPDNRIGYLLEAQSQHSGPLNISFELATDRGNPYHGTVRQIASRTELNESNRPIVRVTMDVDEDARAVLRPGATVFAKVHCGRRSIGYVWFHDLIDALHSWIAY